jgi:hypothetical protein
VQERPADHGGWFYASYPSHSLEALRLSLTSPLAFGRNRSRASEALRALSDTHRSRGSCYGSRGSSRRGERPVVSFPRTVLSLKQSTEPTQIHCVLKHLVHCEGV